MKKLYICDGVTKYNFQKLEDILYSYSKTSLELITNRLTRCLYGEKDRDGLLKNIYICSIDENRLEHIRDILVNLNVEIRI